MPNANLFKPQSEGVIRESLRAQKDQGRARLKTEYDLAVDYIEGRQLEDCRKQLRLRHKQQMSGSKGLEINPVVWPITERYTAETASLYNKPVDRKLVNTETGEVDEAATAALLEMTNAGRLDAYMQRLTQIMVTVGTCSLWPQLRRGQLAFRIVLPQRTNPVADHWDPRFDPGSQDDYFGFVANLEPPEDDRKTEPSQFVLLTAAEHIYYTADEWHDWNGDLAKYPNTFTWPQVLDTDDGKGSEPQDLPLQMLVLFHKRIPLGEIIVDTDPEIVYLNRELNVEWSVLMDVVRRQGHGQLWGRFLGQPPAIMSVGPSHMMALGPEEEIGYEGAANDYDKTVNVLQSAVKLLAVTKRLSPNDFALAPQGPESGFAKLIDSLPKLAARDELAGQMKHSEENLLWPRLGSIAKFTGAIPNADKLKMQVTYAGVTFPRTVAEETQQDEHDFRHGLSSPAEKLAKRDGIPIEEAEERISKNRMSVQVRAQVEGAIAGAGGGVKVEAQTTPVDEGTGERRDTESGESVKPKEALNGAQVTAIVDIATKVAAGELPRDSALAIVQTSYPIDEATAQSMMPQEMEKPAKSEPEPEPRPGRKTRKLGNRIGRRSAGDVDSE